MLALMFAIFGLGHGLVLMPLWGLVFGLAANSVALIADAAMVTTLAMVRSAHRFSVLLPLDSVESDPSEQSTWLGLATRIVELEKPAHTTFDVRFYWAFNRIGEARLGLDTQLGAGSRAPELIPSAALSGIGLLLMMFIFLRRDHSAPASPSNANTPARAGSVP